jgi:hypothetical protein
VHVGCGPGASLVRLMERERRDEPGFSNPLRAILLGSALAKPWDRDSDRRCSPDNRAEVQAKEWTSCGVQPRAGDRARRKEQVHELMR